MHNLRWKKKSQLNVGLKLKRLEIEKLPVLTAHLLTWGFTAPEIMPDFENESLQLENDGSWQQRSVMW